MVCGGTEAVITPLGIGGFSPLERGFPGGNPSPPPF